MSIYNGFSSNKFTASKSFLVNDADVIKQDILNHIYTRRGERVKMPTFGTRIPDLRFEPLDDVTLYMISSDLQDVFNFDPRLQLKDLRVIPLYDSQVVMAFADVYYTYLGFDDQYSINITFEKAA